MDLRIHDQLFLVTGASSGLGRAVLERLVEEGAAAIVVARKEADLQMIAREYPNVEYIAGDVTHADTLKAIEGLVSKRKLSGVFVNAGGPPAMTFMESTPDDWDRAYAGVFRWKMVLVQQLIPHMRRNAYGRILFSESVSVVHPVENLVLSNALRMAVVGMARTIASEVAGDGITANVIGPGYHETNAIQRLFDKKSRQAGITTEQARQQTLDKIPLGRTGDPHDFASLALWLLSPLSNYVTGETFMVSGGA